MSRSIESSLQDELFKDTNLAALVADGPDKYMQNFCEKHLKDVRKLYRCLKPDVDALDKCSAEIKMLMDKWMNMLTKYGYKYSWDDHQKLQLKLYCLRKLNGEEENDPDTCQQGFSEVYHWPSTHGNQLCSWVLKQLKKCPEERLKLEKELERCEQHKASLLEACKHLKELIDNSDKFKDILQESYLNMTNAISERTNAALRHAKENIMKEYHE